MTKLIPSRPTNISEKIRDAFDGNFSGLGDFVHSEFFFRNPVRRNA
jgi:hypothetical protein